MFFFSPSNRDLVKIYEYIAVSSEESLSFFFFSHDIDFFPGSTPVLLPAHILRCLSVSSRCHLHSVCLVNLKLHLGAELHSGTNFCQKYCLLHICVISVDAPYLFCPTISNAKFYPLVKVATARFLYIKVVFPFAIGR